MVFGGENDAAKAGILKGFRPLIGIQICGLEQIGVFLAVAPFRIGEGIHAEMNES